MGQAEIFTEQDKLAAVTVDGLAIANFENPSSSIQLAAVRQTGKAIAYIINPSVEIQLEAVSKEAFAIRYIAKPAEEAQCASIMRDWRSIAYINDPTRSVRLLQMALEFGIAPAELERMAELLERFQANVKPAIGAHTAEASSAEFISIAKAFARCGERSKT